MSEEKRGKVVECEVPGELILRSSQTEPSKFGVWCKKSIKKGAKYGPFTGEKAYEVDETMELNYVWEIVDVESKEMLFYVNATNPRFSNWMRHVNGAKSYADQNIISRQEGIDIFYYAVKDIQPGEELLSFFEKTPVKKKKGKKKIGPLVKRAQTTEEIKAIEKSSEVSMRGRRRLVRKIWKETGNEGQDETDEEEEEVESSEEENNWNSKNVNTTKENDETINSEIKIIKEISKDQIKNKVDGYFNFDEMFENLPSTPLPSSKASSSTSSLKSFKCDLCLGIYKHLFSLKRHYLRSHINLQRVSPLDAVTCGVQLPPEDSTTNFNQKQLEKLPLFRCNICDKLFQDKNCLKEHFAEHGPNSEILLKNYSCSICHMSFKHKQNLLRHEVTHTGAKPFSCNQCNKSFPTSTNQKRHEKIHDGHRLQCGVCSSTFTQAGDLKKHICRQHPESFFECAYCSKYFTEENLLNLHLGEVHEKDGEANRRRVCVKKKARKMLLERDRAESRRLAIEEVDNRKSSHQQQQVRSDEAFACTVCKKCFQNYSNMCRHRRLAHFRDGGEQPWNKLEEMFDESYFDDENNWKDEESLVGGLLGKSSEKYESLQHYFHRVSGNIVANLDQFLEGTRDQIEQASHHIKWRQKTPQKLSKSHTGEGIVLSDYNFPHDYTLPEEKCFQEMKKETGEAVKRESEEETEKDFFAEDPLISISLPSPPDDSGIHDYSMKPQDKPPASSFSSRPFQFTPPEDVLDLSNHVTCLFNSPDYPQEAKCRMGLKVDSSLFNSNGIVEKNINTSKPEEEKDENQNEKKEDDGEDEDETKFICLVCYEEYEEKEKLVSHQEVSHPNVDTRYVEVNRKFKVTWHKSPSFVGQLNVISSILPPQKDEKINKEDEKGRREEAKVDSPLEFVCTKCKQIFSTRFLLHQHISEDCGDYWKKLNQRVSWVFVLRGNEIPAGENRRRGKGKDVCQNEEIYKRQLQKMLIQQHVGEKQDGVDQVSHFQTPIPSSTTSSPLTLKSNSSKVLTRRRSQESGVTVVRGLDDPDCIVRAKRKETLMLASKRLKAEMAVETNSSPPRVGGGEEEEEDDDGMEYDANKHLCIYCRHQFIYLKTLKKHIFEFCHVRREMKAREDPLDLEWETEILEKVQTPVELEEEIDGKKVINKKKKKRNWNTRTKNTTTNNNNHSNNNISSSSSYSSSSLVDINKSFEQLLQGKIINNDNNNNIKLKENNSNSKAQENNTNNKNNNNNIISNVLIVCESEVGNATNITNRNNDNIKTKINYQYISFEKNNNNGNNNNNNSNYNNSNNNNKNNNYNNKTDKNKEKTVEPNDKKKEEEEDEDDEENKGEGDGRSEMKKRKRRGPRLTMSRRKKN